jgi:hypothetical protein
VLTLEELEVVVPAMEILSDAVSREGSGALEDTAKQCFVRGCADSLLRGFGASANLV